MADSSLNIGITLTGASQAAQATSTLSQGMGAVVIQVNKLNQATQQLNQTQAQTASAMKQTQTATGNAAMSLLFLSQAIEDAQYGFGAVLNNIPLIIMGMGYSAGVAGAVSIAGVAVNVLTKNLDLLGTTQHDVAVKAAETAAAMRDSAAAKEKAAVASDKESKSLRELEEHLRTVNKLYDESVDSIERVTKATLKKADLEYSVYDVDFDQAVARVKLRKEQGQITEFQETQEIANLKIAAIERKKQVEITKAEISARAELSKIKEAEAAMSEYADIQVDLKSKTSGLLSPKMREALKNKRGTAFETKNATLQELNDLHNPSLSSKTMDIVNMATLDFVNTMSPGAQKPLPGSEEYLRVQMEYVEKRKQFLLKQYNIADTELKEADKRLEADKRSKAALGGVDDPEQVYAKIKQAKEKFDEIEKQKKISEDEVKKINEELDYNKRILDGKKTVVSVTASTDAIKDLEKIKKAKEVSDAKAQREKEAEERAMEAIHNDDVAILSYARGMNRNDGVGGIFRGKSKGKLPTGAKGVDPRLARLSSMVESMGADGYTSAESDRILKDVEVALKGWASKSNDTEIKLARLAEMIRDHSSRLDKTRN